MVRQQRKEREQRIAALTRHLHRMLRDELRNSDPYREQKLRATTDALSFLGEAEQRVREAPDPFLEAVVIAIASNLLDLGAPGGSDAPVAELMEQAVDVQLDPDAVAELRQAVRRASSVLYLADNAGEIVLDRPLIDQIGRDKVTVGVRGSPIINDATRFDADLAGLTGCYRIIDNGSDIPGTWLPECTESFVREFEQADVVLAKGQGNYETLSDCAREVFFLFRVKCQAVARDVGAAMGSFVAACKPADSSG